MGMYIVKIVVGIHVRVHHVQICSINLDTLCISQVTLALDIYSTSCLHVSLSVCVSSGNN
jgi:hypothetical protein